MELEQQLLAEVRPFVDMDVCHMYMHQINQLDVQTPRVIELYQSPVDFIPDEKTQWDIARNHVDSQLKIIKSMDITQIPKALVELFTEYASEESLGADYAGHESGVGIDREFATSAMESVFSHLGSGSFSVAYRLSEQWIIKMNIADVAYEWGEDGGFDWAKACTEIQGNIFAPKIAALYQKGGVYAMVVESLHENHDVEAPDGGCFRDLAESYHPDLNFGEYISDMMEHETFVFMAAINRDDLIQMSMVFDATAVKVNNNNGDDLSDFNMMLRGKIPVVNDPFGTSNSKELVEGSVFEWTM